MASLTLLSKSEFTEKYISILQPLEVFVAGFYRQNPELHDHDVLADTKTYQNISEPN